LPESVISHITNSVKKNLTPENFKYAEEFKDFEKRIEDIEDKAAKNFGQAKPKNSNSDTPSKYEAEDIGFD